MKAAELRHYYRAAGLHPVTGRAFVEDGRMCSGCRFYARVRGFHEDFYRCLKVDGDGSFGVRGKRACVLHEGRLCAVEEE